MHKYALHILSTALYSLIARSAWPLRGRSPALDYVQNNTLRRFCKRNSYLRFELDSVGFRITLASKFPFRLGVSLKKILFICPPRKISGSLISIPSSSSGRPPESLRLSTQLVLSSSSFLCYKFWPHELPIAVSVRFFGPDFQAENFSHRTAVRDAICEPHKLAVHQLRQFRLMNFNLCSLQSHSHGFMLA